MRRLFGTVALCVAAMLVAAGTATAQDPLPVDYNFFSGIPNELLDHGGSLPGSNDWNCKPSAAHPEPVVLAHGTAGGAQTNWGVYVPLLKNAGYCVYALTYGNYRSAPWPLSAIGGMLPMEQSAVDFGAFVDRVLAATGASKVDVVGHSQGTVMPNYYAKRLGGANKIDKYVSIAPAWHGTDIVAASQLVRFIKALGAYSLLDATVYALCGACGELVQGSQFLHDLNADGTYVPGITYTNIMTKYDDVVVPYTNGYVSGPNATNIVMQDTCAQDYSDHLGIAGSPRAAAVVLNALDPAHPRPVPCEFVPPVTG